MARFLWPVGEQINEVQLYTLYITCHITTSNQELKSSDLVALVLKSCDAALMLLSYLTFKRHWKATESYLSSVPQLKCLYMGQAIEVGGCWPKEAYSILHGNGINSSTNNSAKSLRAG